MRIYKTILKILSFLLLKRAGAGRNTEEKSLFLIFYAKASSSERNAKWKSYFYPSKGSLARICTLTVLLVSISSTYSQGIVIVKDNIPNASIVISPTASPQIVKAAKFLQDAIQKSTRASLPIITSAIKTQISINVGETDFIKAEKIDLRKLDEDGFLLQKADANNFVIIGGSDWGTEFGVYSFLERFLGVVDLMPTNIGMDIPLHSTLIIPDVKIIDNPVYLSREISPIHIESGSALGNWGRFNRLRGRISVQHNLLNLFDPIEYAKTNPDFYSNYETIKNLTKNSNWQPNFSAPGIADSAANKILRYFKTNPQANNYSLAINDNANFDESPSSKARRKGTEGNFSLSENISNDYFEWANEVARKVTSIYPNKIFGLLAYWKISEPPSKNIGIDPHLVPFLTNERMRWSDSTLKREGHELNYRWTSLATAIGWYDYTYGYNYLVPRIWFHEMQDYLIWGCEHKVKYYYAESYPNWGEGPKSWIQAKLLWNPKLNVDSLLNVWYIRTAGNKGSKKLNEFYKIWEKYWTIDIFKTNWITLNHSPFLNLSYLEAVPDSYVSYSDSLMNEAYNLCETPIQQQRVGKLRDMWELYKMAIKIYKDNNIEEARKKQTLISSPIFIDILNSLEADALLSSSIKSIKSSFGIK